MCIHTFRGAFLEKPVFHIKPFEVIFPLWMSGKCLSYSGNWFLDSENLFLEFGTAAGWSSHTALSLIVILDRSACAISTNFEVLIFIDFIVFLLYFGLL